MKDIALVIPSIRENCFNDFIERWKPTGLFDQVHLVLMEDNPKKTFSLKGKGIPYYDHFSWEEIDYDLGDKSWIIPRRSDTVRSFGYWYAATCSFNFKYIMTLDDDCYPDENFSNLAEFHVSTLNNRTKWWNTLNSGKPRGIPYENLGKTEVYINHGLWTNFLDYDAPTQLAAPFQEKFSYDNQVVPAGFYFPFCGMNAMWRSEVTVLMYHLLMGSRFRPLAERDTDRELVKLPIDRFGDIWCGIIAKKICDHLGYPVSSGTPYIRHERASNPFVNLMKEANGISMNEQFWQLIDEVLLSETDPVRCYRQLAKSAKATLIHFDKLLPFKEHLDMMFDAMIVWSELFVIPREV